MPMSFTDEAKKIAKEQGLYLVRLELNGRLAKKASTEMCGPVGPETAKKVQDLLVTLANVTERMK